MDELKGKVAIITGSSSGIGAGIAEHFASCGCKVVLTARRQQQLEDVKQKCIGKGLKANEVLTVVADVTKMADLDKIISETVNKFGQINYLINNAGMTIFKGIRLMEEHEYDQIMNVNVKSAQFLSKKALPHLAKTKGCIVNTSSVAGFRVAPVCATYCMSKAAMNMLTKCLAADFCSSGVRVNAANPGIIDTPIFEGTPVVDMPANAALMNPIGRAGTPLEVAQLVAFLCREKTAGFITGNTAVIDGGDQIFTPLPEAMQDMQARMLGHPPYDK